MVAGLIIAGIHSYLGLHVVERGVIFVDLSLAQIASLGAAIAVWQGYDPHDPMIYWMSLIFTLIGAFIFAMIKGQDAHIPQEAIIGISYAVASAAVIIIMSKSTGEAEHLKDMLVGNILSVQWPEVWLTGGIYVVIGAFHWVFRKRFLEISQDPKAAAARGISVRFWDFLFYVRPCLGPTGVRPPSRGRHRAARTHRPDHRPRAAARHRRAGFRPCARGTRSPHPARGGGITMSPEAGAPLAGMRRGASGRRPTRGVPVQRRWPDEAAPMSPEAGAPRALRAGALRYSSPR